MDEITSALPFTAIGELDALYDQAHAGAKAATALDTVRAELSARRNSLYHKFLNEQKPENLLRFQAELRAIEILANSLLVKATQGDIAWEALQRTRQEGDTVETSTSPFVPERPKRVGRRRAGGITP